MTSQRVLSYTRSETWTFFIQFKSVFPKYFHLFPATLWEVYLFICLFILFILGRGEYEAKLFAKWGYRNVRDIPQQPQITFGKLREFYVHWDLWANIGMTSIHWDARVPHSCHVVAAPPPLLTTSPTNPHTLLCLCWGAWVWLKLWPWISKFGAGIARYVFSCWSDVGRWRCCAQTLSSQSKR